MYIKRMSQMPVEPQDLEDYKQARRDLYDTIEKDLGEAKASLTSEEMEAWQTRLDQGMVVLDENYTFQKKIDFPKTQKDFKKLLNTYGPIVITYNEKQQLQLVIMDERF